MVYGNQAAAVLDIVNDMVNAFWFPDGTASIHEHGFVLCECLGVEVFELIAVCEIDA